MYLPDIKSEEELSQKVEESCLLITFLFNIYANIIFFLQDASYLSLYMSSKRLGVTM